MTFDEIMNFNVPYNKDIFQDILKQIKNNNIVPYVGAGMSVLFEDVYPLWNEFLYNTFNKFCEEISKNEFDNLSSEDKAEFLYKNIGMVTFNKHLISI